MQRGEDIPSSPVSSLRVTHVSSSFSDRRACCALRSRRGGYPPSPKGAAANWPCWKIRRRRRHNSHEPKNHPATDREPLHHQSLSHEDLPISRGLPRVAYERPSLSIAVELCIEPDALASSAHNAGANR